MSPITTHFVEEVGGICVAELQKWAEAAQRGRVACLQLPSYRRYLPREGLAPLSPEMTQAVGIWALSSGTAVSVQ